MASRADLIELTLQKLGVWQAGQDLPPEDYHVVDKNLERYLAAMAKADIYVVDDSDNIPDEALTEIAAYLANEYAGSFGVAGEELKTLERNAGYADQALRYQRRIGPTYQLQQADYF